MSHGLPKEMLAWVVREERHGDPIDAMKLETVPVPTPEALALLLGYDWPGNVRELRNVLERVVLRHLDVVTPDDLPRELRLGASAAPVATDAPAEETFQLHVYG